MKCVWNMEYDLYMEFGICSVYGIWNMTFSKVSTIVIYRGKFLYNFEYHKFQDIFHEADFDIPHVHCIFSS